ncbi:ACT domain-containing protein [Rhizobiaceae bacterium n13]|uniref:ACT domain-containing protein n=1 Tax=Ferirhizobium litorale TaxID=2927786 RepID=A0AAE3QFH3_9HYPH|nr:ACT domain-containing protein [Fererhizobium litorale]MDI7863725.1 ACT domain-containing protein [Fererhizobium litorale]MDI7924175.1 ACT domain-containing protein [Fererhizobium litorale]
MRGISDLDTLLAEMTPELIPVDYVFATVPTDEVSIYLALEPLGTFREAEGVTLILPRDTALDRGLVASAPMQCITLAVHSSLEAVGLTAAVATELARHGISANVLAAYHHDHVFVPSAQADRALEALLALSRNKRTGR